MERREIDSVIYEKDGPIARIILNNPKRGNVQDQTMVWAFDKALSECEYDYDVKVVIIGANGKGFCGGHLASGDYPEFLENRERTGTTWQGQTKLFLHPVLRLWEFPKPTIARVHGYAVGGGSYWALLPDITVASEDAWFQMPHVHLMGLPGAETMIEPWLFMNYKRAMEYLYRKKKLTAKVACELGLVNEVVPRDQLDETVEEIAREIAEAPLTGLQATKLMVKRAWEMMGMRLHQQWSNDMLSLTSRHTDTLDHMYANMEKSKGKTDK